MPLYLKNKLCLIHIPKTGGSAIEHAMAQADDNNVFHSTYAIMNGHSPQHSTAKELMDLGLLPVDFKVIAVTRHPYERFVSEYNYQRTYQNYHKGVNEFAKDFFNTSNWDNHHLAMCDFLFVEGKLSDRVELIEYGRLAEDFERITGIALYERKLESVKWFEGELPEEIKTAVRSYWAIDFKTFPQYTP